MAMEHATFGVVFLIEHGDIPASYVNFPEGTFFLQELKFFKWNSKMAFIFWLIWRLSIWWFQLFLIFTLTLGNDPIWLIYFSDGLGWNHQLLKHSLWKKSPLNEGKNLPFRIPQKPPKVDRQCRLHLALGSHQTFKPIVEKTTTKTVSVGSWISDGRCNMWVDRGGKMEDLNFLGKLWIPSMDLNNLNIFLLLRRYDYPIDSPRSTWCCQCRPCLPSNVYMTSSPSQGLSYLFVLTTIEREPNVIGILYLKTTWAAERVLMMFWHG